MASAECQICSKVTRVPKYRGSVAGMLCKNCLGAGAAKEMQGETQPGPGKRKLFEKPAPMRSPGLQPQAKWKCPGPPLPCLVALPRLVALPLAPTLPKLPPYRAPAPMIPKIIPITLAPMQDRGPEVQRPRVLVASPPKNPPPPHVLASHIYGDDGIDDWVNKILSHGPQAKKQRKPLPLLNKACTPVHGARA